MQNFVGLVTKRDTIWKKWLVHQVVKTKIVASYIDKTVTGLK